MFYFDTLEILQDAALKLSQGGAIKDRLFEAYTCHLSQLDQQGIPAELREDFEALCTAMQREQPLPRETVARASVRKMSNEEVVRHAAMVVHLLVAVARAGSQPLPRRKPRQVGSAPIVNLFAADNADTGVFNRA